MSGASVPYIGFSAQFAEERTDLLAAVEGVLRRGDFILGADVQEFEREFAELCGTKHAIAMGNGTDTLILGLKVLGVGPGDEVITAPNSFVGSASSIAHVGAKPVFADVQPDQNISPEAIERAITPRTKAIMPVHLTGRVADMPRILEIARRHKLEVIEDAAQSVGASLNGTRSGAFARLASFSLHPLKNLNAAGDAGILTTSDDALAARLRLLRHHGLKNRDEVVEWGFNSRLDTIQAAILRVRMRKLPDYTERRRANAMAYHEGLAGIGGITELPVEKPGERHVYHVYVIQCDRRDELQAHLAKLGIETKVHYPIPIHLQEAARDLGLGRGSFPVTERQSERILSLPIHPYLARAQIDAVIREIRGFYRSA